MIDPPTVATTVLTFWFNELKPAQWWRRDAAVDGAIRERFGDIHQALAAGLGEGWLARPDTALAAVIVLDQFSRNLYRDDARAFAQDGRARSAANAAIALGHDAAFEPGWRAFFYMPFLHSENPADQARSLMLFTKMGEEKHVDAAREHKAQIDQFGRFPGRNEAMGRASTPEELMFLDDRRRRRAKTNQPPAADEPS